MWPVLEIGSRLSLSWFAVGVILMSVVTCFWWWKEMRIDCEEERIFAGVWRLVLFLGLALWLFKGVSGISMSVVWVITLGFWWRWSRYNKWNMWEWLDVIVPSGLLASAVGNFSWGLGRWRYTVAYLVVLGLTWILGRTYRQIKWYASGKVGFVGLAGLGLWAVAELVVEIWSVNGIYWVGLTIEQWLAVWILTASIVAIYLRSGRKITKDLPFLASKN